MQILSEILKSKKLSQRRFAKMIGVDPAMITLYVKGTCEPSLSTFRKICEVLEVSADYLLGLNLGGGVLN